jgi:hypothetical protein
MTEEQITELMMGKTIEEIERNNTIVEQALLIKKLERELAEARKQRDAYIQAADKSLIETHDLIESLSECVGQRDTLAEVCTVLVALTEDMSNNKDVGNRLIIAWTDVDKALSAVKGGQHDPT